MPPLHQVYRTHRPYLALLGALAVVNLAVIAGDWPHRLGTDGFGDWRWNIELEAGWAEILRGVQMCTAAGVLLLLAARTPRAWVLAGWAVVLVSLTVDDITAVHERGSIVLVESLGLTPAFGLRAMDFGELLVWGLMGLVLGTLLLVTHLLSSPPARAASWRLAALAAVVMVLSVTLDMGGVMAMDRMPFRVYYAMSLAESTVEGIGAAAFTVLALFYARRGLPGRHTQATPSTEP